MFINWIRWGTCWRAEHVKDIILYSRPKIIKVEQRQPEHLMAIAYRYQCPFNVPKPAERMDQESILLPMPALFSAYRPHAAEHLPTMAVRLGRTKPVVVGVQQHSADATPTDVAFRPIARRWAPCATTSFSIVIVVKRVCFVRRQVVVVPRQSPPFLAHLLVCRPLVTGGWWRRCGRFWRSCDLRCCCCYNRRWRSRQRRLRWWGR